MKVEILLHPRDPEGFLILFAEKDIRENKREKIMKIQRMLMTDLIEKKYIPKQTQIEEKEGLLYFPIFVRYPRAELKNDLRRALSNILKKEKERKVK